MKTKSLYLIWVLLFSACATYNSQYKKESNASTFPTNKEIAHTFYLIGDAGNSAIGKSSKALTAFKKELANANENSTALFLGDNVYPKGIPSKDSEDYTLSKHRLDIQIDAVKDFKGNPIFIAGNHDWYSGLKGLKKQEEAINKALGEKSFLPNAGCPIDKVHISDAIDLIIVDSHWYLTNWNKHPKINDGCDIKTRADFFNEFSGLVKKARNKTTIVALHHPLFTNGAHGGEFSFADHMKPLPVLGTIKNVLRKTGGVSNADLQHKRYNDFKSRLATIAQVNETVIFASGHEHNLQYLIQDNLHQIVSGSGSKTKAVRNKGAGIFGYATEGYTKLDVFKDGSSHVRFYSVDEDKVVFETEVFPPHAKTISKEYPDSFPATVTSSIYTKEETTKSGFHNYLWGDRYRNLYSTGVTVPTVNLDTLFGGVTVGRQGGGTQSKSLRLVTKDGKNYVMRAMRKQGGQFLQTMFQNEYVGGQFEGTSTEALIMDVFTGSHPYASFVIGDLSDAAGIYHLNPKLYYIPKQKALGDMNTLFGDELYMIEEHGSDGHGDKASFGHSNTVVSTADAIKKIDKNGKYLLDEKAHIKARLFDMLIGDWDRHQDQWRWLQFEENGKKVLRPLPRDRDQSFSIMSDGALLNTAVTLVPGSRLLRKYSDDLKDLKGTTVGRFQLDVELIQESDMAVWLEQAKYLQENVTDEAIEKAFLNLPKEVIDESTEKIKKTMKARRGNLLKIAERYYKLVSKYAVIKGTNKSDVFDIERLDNGKTEVTGYRLKKGEKEDVFHHRVYDADVTKEIWIYGLNDDDVFNVFGNGKAKIRVRLVGGQNNDTYDIKEGKKVAFYDYKSKESNIVTKKGSKKLTDDYDTNVYDYNKLKNNVTQLIPTIASNPDDGFKVGASFSKTNYGFERNPFTSQHKLNAAYYFSTSGVEAGYSSEFANVIGKLNFGIEADFTSASFATNFFGFGNESSNLNKDDDDIYDLDFNRVKIQSFAVKPSLIWRGQLGGSLKLGAFYENNEVENTEDRFISSTDSPFTANNPIFDSQDFWGVDAKYHFANKNNAAFPTLGFQVALETGYKRNFDTENNGFAYVIPEIGFDYKLIPSGKLVLATDFRGHINLGNDYEFYQAASIGGDNGLRGFRNERFTGKNAYTQSTDVRWSFSNLKTNIVPVQLGIYAGLDYGRVWENNDNSDEWHNSYGGGFFVNITNLLTANISAFNSDEDLRLAFKLGFGF